MNNILKLICIILLGVTSFLSICFAFTLQGVFIAMETQDMDALTNVVLIMLGLIVGIFLIQVISMKFRMTYIRRKMIDINKRYFAKDITSKKDVDMSSYSTKTEMIVQNYLIPQIFIPYNIIELTLTVIAYMWLSPIYVLYMILVVVVMMIIPSLTQKKSQKLTADYTATSKNYINFLNNVFNSKRELNQYNSVETFSKKHDNETAKLFENYEKHGMFIKNVAIFSNSIATTTFIGIVIISSALVVNGEMELALFITSIQLMNHFITPIFSVVDDVNKYKSMKKEIPDLKEIISFPPNTSLVINEKIELNNLSFSYDENKITYPNITFNKNKKYLITGKSGTGKSTLAKILSGEICDYNGEIVVDSNKENLLSSIIYVPQSAHLFYGSVEDNITLNRNLDNNNTKTAMELANVEIDLLNKMIDVNSEVSGGEKARISLARSLACRPKIMIIDEPTANLDYKNSIDIMTKLCDIDDLTLIVISHETDDEFISCFDQVVNL